MQTMMKISVALTSAALAVSGNANLELDGAGAKITYGMPILRSCNMAFLVPSLLVASLLDRLSFCPSWSLTSLHLSSWTRFFSTRFWPASAHWKVRPPCPISPCLLDLLFFWTAADTATPKSQRLKLQKALWKVIINSPFIALPLPFISVYLTLSPIFFDSRGCSCQCG